MFAIEPWHWFILGLVLVSLEVMIPTFTFLIFGCSALLVALLSWLLPIGNIAQIIIWLILSIVIAFLWFKIFKPRFKMNDEDKVESLIGQTAMIIESPSDLNKGRVRFTVPLQGVDEWECESTDIIKIGDKVIVKNIKDNLLVVSKV